MQQQSIVITHEESGNSRTIEQIEIHPKLRDGKHVFETRKLQTQQKYRFDAAQAKMERNWVEVARTPTASKIQNPRPADGEFPGDVYPPITPHTVSKKAPDSFNGEPSGPDVVAEFLATSDIRSTEKLKFLIDSKPSAYTFGIARKDVQETREMIGGSASRHHAPTARPRVAHDKIHGDTFEPGGPDVVAEFLATVDRQDTEKLNFEWMPVPLKYNFGVAKHGPETNDTKTNNGKMERSKSKDKTESLHRNNSLRSDLPLDMTNWLDFAAPPAEEHQRPLQLCTDEGGRLCARSEPPHPRVRVMRDCLAHDTAMYTPTLATPEPAGHEGCYADSNSPRIGKRSLTLVSTENSIKMEITLMPEPIKYSFGAPKVYIAEDMILGDSKSTDPANGQSPEESVTSGVDKIGARAELNVTCQSCGRDAPGSTNNVRDITSPPPPFVATTSKEIDLTRAQSLKVSTWGDQTTPWDAVQLDLVIDGRLTVDCCSKEDWIQREIERQLHLGGKHTQSLSVVTQKEGRVVDRALGSVAPSQGELKRAMLNETVKTPKQAPCGKHNLPKVPDPALSTSLSPRGSQESKRCAAHDVQVEESESNCAHSAEAEGRNLDLHPGLDVPFHHRPPCDLSPIQVRRDESSCVLPVVVAEPPMDWQAPQPPSPSIYFNTSQTDQARGVSSVLKGLDLISAKSLKVSTWENQTTPWDAVQLDLVLDGRLTVDCCRKEDWIQKEIKRQLHLKSQLTPSGSAVTRREDGVVGRALGSSAVSRVHNQAQEIETDQNNELSGNGKGCLVMEEEAMGGEDRVLSRDRFSSSGIVKHRVGVATRKLGDFLPKDGIKCSKGRRRVPCHKDEVSREIAEAGSEIAHQVVQLADEHVVLLPNRGDVILHGKASQAQQKYRVLLPKQDTSRDWILPLPSMSGMCLSRKTEGILPTPEQRVTPAEVAQQERASATVPQASPSLLQGGEGILLSPAAPRGGVPRTRRDKSADHNIAPTTLPCERSSTTSPSANASQQQDPPGRQAQLLLTSTEVSCAQGALTVTHHDSSELQRHHPTLFSKSNTHQRRHAAHRLRNQTQPSMGGLQGSLGERITAVSSNIVHIRQREAPLLGTADVGCIGSLTGRIFKPVNAWKQVQRRLSDQQSLPHRRIEASRKPQVSVPVEQQHQPRHLSRMMLKSELAGTVSSRMNMTADGFPLLGIMAEMGAAGVLSLRAESAGQQDHTGQRSHRQEPRQSKRHKNRRFCKRKERLARPPSLEARDGKQSSTLGEGLRDQYRERRNHLSCLELQIDSRTEDMGNQGVSIEATCRGQGEQLGSQVANNETNEQMNIPNLPQEEELAEGGDLGVDLLESTIRNTMLSWKSAGDLEIMEGTLTHQVIVSAERHSGLPMSNSGDTGTRDLRVHTTGEIFGALSQVREREVSVVTKIEMVDLVLGLEMPLSFILRPPLWNKMFNEALPYCWHWQFCILGQESKGVLECHSEIRAALTMDHRLRLNIWSPSNSLQPRVERAGEVDLWFEVENINKVLLPMRCGDWQSMIEIRREHWIDLKDIISKAVPSSGHSTNRMQLQTRFIGEDGEARGLPQLRPLGTSKEPSSWEELCVFVRKSGFLDTWHLYLCGADSPPVQMQGAEQQAQLVQPIAYTSDQDWEAIDQALKEIRSAQPAPPQPSVAWTQAAILYNAVNIQQMDCLHGRPPHPYHILISPARVAALKIIINRTLPVLQQIPPWASEANWLAVRVQGLRARDLLLGEDPRGGFAQQKADMIAGFRRLLMTVVPELQHLMIDSIDQEMMKFIINRTVLRFDLGVTQHISITTILPKGNWREELLLEQRPLPAGACVRLNSCTGFVEVGLGLHDGALLKALGMAMQVEERRFCDMLALALSMALEGTFVQVRFSIEKSGKKQAFFDPGSPQSEIMVSLSLAVLLKTHRRKNTITLCLGFGVECPIEIAIEPPEPPISALFGILKTARPGPIRLLPLGQPLDPPLSSPHLVIGPFHKDWLSALTGRDSSQEGHTLIQILEAIRTSVAGLVPTFVGRGGSQPFAIHLTCPNSEEASRLVTHYRQSALHGIALSAFALDAEFLFESLVPEECLALMGEKEMREMINQWRQAGLSGSAIPKDAHSS